MSAAVGANAGTAALTTIPAKAVSKHSRPRAAPRRPRRSSAPAPRTLAMTTTSTASMIPTATSRVTAHTALVATSPTAHSRVLEEMNRVRIATACGSACAPAGPTDSGAAACRVVPPSVRCTSSVPRAPSTRSVRAASVSSSTSSPSPTSSSSACPRRSRSAAVSPAGRSGAAAGHDERVERGPDVGGQP